MDELIEIAGYAGVKIAITNEIKTGISARQATLLYDFFYNAIDRTIPNGNSIIVRAAQENGAITLRLLLPPNLSFDVTENLIRAINRAGGTFSVKDLDDAVGIELSFGGGGKSDD